MSVESINSNRKVEIHIPIKDFLQEDYEALDIYERICEYSAEVGILFPSAEDMSCDQNEDEHLERTLFFLISDLQSLKRIRSKNKTRECRITPAMVEKLMREDAERIAATARQ